MIEPTAAQVAALALPGDDLDTGLARARRLLNAVEQCAPCPDCDQQLSTPCGYTHRSFLDAVHDCCYGCPAEAPLCDFPDDCDDEE